MTKSELPNGLGAPAQRALQGAAIRSVEDLINFTQKEIAQLHGIGKNALQKLEAALEEARLTWKSPQ
jgi:predicted RecB family nuclease